MRRWMILGGGGVFGIHLARHLLSDPNVERVVSVGRNPWPAKPYSLGAGNGDGRFRHEQVHIVHEQRRLCALIDYERPDCIVNFAALAYTQWQDAALFYKTNVVALAELTEWLFGKPWLKRFVQIGTSELYGSCDIPATESSPPRPTNPYAVSKLAADLHLLTLTPSGFPAVIIRPSNVYGEGQQLYRIAPRAAWAAVMGARVPLQGGGMAEKSYMHVDDLSRAVRLVAERGTGGCIYNAGPDEPIKIRTLVEAIAVVAGLSMGDLVEDAPARNGEDARYWLDSTAIKGLGWKPAVDLYSGARRMVAWAREYKDQLIAPAPFVLRV